jgi:hypothetical protein
MSRALAVPEGSSNDAAVLKSWPVTSRQSDSDLITVPCGCAVIEFFGIAVVVKDPDILP